MEFYNVSSLDTSKYNEEYFSQDNICRFCWNDSAEIDCFECKTKGNILEMISECLNLVETSDIQLKKLCQRCYDNLYFFNNFKNFCQTSNRKLMELQLKQLNISSSLKTEPVSDDNCYHDDSNEDDAPLNTLKTKVPLKKNYQKKKTETYCNICAIDYKSLKNLQNHFSKLHGRENGRFHCFGCNQNFSSSRSRHMHEKRCKNLIKGYLCSECNIYLPTRRVYEWHLRSHKRTVKTLPSYFLKCKICDKQFDDRLSFKKHSDLHTVKKKYVCERCGKSFDRKDYLRHHMTTHTGAKDHICTICNHKTNTRSSLVLHIRKHTGERPYSCDLCPQKCISSSNLRAHRLRHFGVKKFECKLCNKKFGYKSTLEDHIASIHESQTHTCELCGATFSHARAVKQHVRKKHGGGKKNDLQVE